MISPPGSKDMGFVGVNDFPAMFMNEEDLAVQQGLVESCVRKHVSDEKEVTLIFEILGLEPL